MKKLQKAETDEFKAQFRGDVLLPGGAEYDETRQIWNAMIDRRPALIARCTSPEDVVQAVQFARNQDLLVSIRGGGHNIAGNAVCDGGLMIDLSLMKGVRVDPKARRAKVGGGCTLGDIDAATQAHGLATSLGINSTTGVAGLTLGGGFGWLTRKYGMTIDNLVSADVVTAEGNQVHASADENADLFWGIRGGGGNFGIVTTFEFELHPVGPEVLCGLIVFPFEQAKSVLTKYRQFVDQMPEELNVWTILRQAPPLPFLPEAVHGKEVVVFALLYAGEVEAGKRAIEPLRGFGKAHGEHIGVQPFADWQKAFDPQLTPGARNYWKTNNFKELSDGAIDAMIANAGKLPSPECDVFIGLLGGKAGRVAPDATAYIHREAPFVMNVHGRWQNPQEDAKCIEWARGVFKETAPYATGGAYINFMTEEEGDRVASAYGPIYDRLVKLKKKYDPSNFFRMNQNIKPV